MPGLRSRLRRRRGTAFVLGGGGNLGAVQVGMLRALVERGIAADFVVGASVGALNGAAFAQEPTRVGVARLDEVWRHMTEPENRVLPTRLLPAAFQLARRGVALDDAQGLRRVARRLLHTESFADLRLPFQCVATDLDGAREVWFDHGPLLEAVMASAALPTVFPPVTIDGVRYIDGAVVNDIPISRAVELGARRVYVLHVGSFDRPLAEPRRPIDMAVQAYWIARRHRFKRDLASLPKGVTAIVLPTGDPPRIAYNDFTRTGELIDHAHDAAASLLDSRSDS